MASDVSKLIRAVEKLSKSIEEEVDDRLPRKLGVLAVQHFKQTSETQAFVMEACNRGSVHSVRSQATSVRVVATRRLPQLATT